MYPIALDIDKPDHTYCCANRVYVRVFSEEKLDHLPGHQTVGSAPQSNHPLSH